MKVTPVGFSLFQVFQKKIIKVNKERRPQKMKWAGTRNISFFLLGLTNYQLISFLSVSGYVASRCFSAELFWRLD